MTLSGLLEDVQSLPVLAWMSPALTAVAVVLVAFLSGYKNSPKGFNVPTLGEDSTDSNALKMRYVHEADVILSRRIRKGSLPSDDPSSQAY